MEELEDSFSQEPPIWAIFGDLMSALVGVFVLLLVWALGFQLELAQSLEHEVQSVRTGIHSYSILDSDISGELFLKCLRLTAQNEPAASQDSLYRISYLLRDSAEFTLKINALYHSTSVTFSSLSS
jgi:hypothetical protein